MKNSIFIFLLSLSFSCMNTTKVDQCLVNHDWCIPNCEKSNMTWKFLTDGSFIVNTTVFGGKEATGKWIDLGENKFLLKYTKTFTGKNIPDQEILKLDCVTLKIKNTIYKRSEL
ncbi:MAG: hypothetical protein CMP68_05200 [Flavobacteriales bacterium]|nr:hypothetical protein [Flavobacteriales bacterium]